MENFWFDINSNKIIRVSICQSGIGGYTFYKTNNLKKQGGRVRMRPAQWFDNLSDAEKALDKYCISKTQYIKLTAKEVARRFEDLKPRRFNPIFGIKI